MFCPVNSVVTLEKAENSRLAFFSVIMPGITPTAKTNETDKKAKIKRINVTRLNCDFFKIMSSSRPILIKLEKNHQTQQPHNNSQTHKVINTKTEEAFKPAETHQHQ